MLQPEAHQSTDEHMCKFNRKSTMREYMKNKPIKWDFKFWFRCGAKSGYLYEFNIYLRKKWNTEFGLGGCYSFIVPEAQRQALFCILWQLFYKSSTIGQAVRNGDLCDRYCKGQPKECVLKHDNEMKRGKHDWFSSNHLSAIKWMDNKSVILLSNYFNPKET